MSDNPVRIALDVDGVLDPYWRNECWGLKCSCHGDGKWVREEIVYDEWRNTYPLTLYPPMGQWLLELAEKHDAELVWATSWNERANEFVAPRLGLPQLRVIPVMQPTSLMTDAMRKARAVIGTIDDKPFVFFDDEVGVGRIVKKYTTQQHLVVKVEKYHGLTQGHVKMADEWLASLKSLSGCYHNDTSCIPRGSRIGET